MECTIYAEMISIECKAYPSREQSSKIENGFRVAQFIRNKTLIPFMEKSDGYGKHGPANLSLQLRKEFPEIAGKLNAQACQNSAQRTWQAISRFYRNCKNNAPGKKGFPKFKKNTRSLEYSQSGWILLGDKRSIKFTDGLGIGKLRLSKSDIGLYSRDQIKRVRLLRKGGVYFVQFMVDVRRLEPQAPTGRTVGLDLGIVNFYTDSRGNKVANPKFRSRQEKKLKKLHKSISRKQKGSANRAKAVQRLAKASYKIQCQRKDFLVKLARNVVKSNDFVALEDLNVTKMSQSKSRKLNKSILDSGWNLFRRWILYYGQVFGRQVRLVNPAYTSQDCSGCGFRVPKELNERTHSCPKCSLVLDRDHNAAINILKLGLRPNQDTGGQSEIYASGHLDLCSS